jgi:hypothetical protein
MQGREGPSQKERSGRTCNHSSLRFWKGNATFAGGALSKEIARCLSFRYFHLVFEMVLPFSQFSL